MDRGAGARCRRSATTRALILVSLPQEAESFCSLLDELHRVARVPYPAWVGSVGETECLVVQTGIGRERARRAAQHFRDAGHTDVVISAGFAGSLSPDLGLGSVVWAREIALLEDIQGPAAQVCTYASLRVPELCRVHGVQPARFLTVDGVHVKAALRGRCAGIPTVLEMESAAVASVAAARGVPFIGLRSISDSWDEEIDWLPDCTLNEAGVLRLRTMAGALCRHPRLLGSILRLRRGAQLAGCSLGRTLLALLQLPANELREAAALLQPLRIPGAASFGGEVLRA